MDAINAKFKVVKALTAMPSDASAGALVGDIVSMKWFGHCDIVIRVGSTADATTEVTLHKGTSVATAATTLAFTRYYQQGKRLYIKNRSDPGIFEVGETVTGGSSSTTGKVYKDMGSYLLLYDVKVSTPAFTADEEISGGTNSYTADVDASISGGSTYGDDECDVLIPRTCSSTFDVLGTTQVECIYVIPIDSADLLDGYVSLELNVADSGAGSNFYMDAFYVFSEARSMDEVGGPSAIID